MSRQQILVINCGSSSVKFSLFDNNKNELASGLAEKLGDYDASITWRQQDRPRIELSLGNAEHTVAIESIISQLNQAKLLEGNLTAIGHRVVHGGEYFSGSVIIDDEVYKKIESCSHLAPLHNPANLLGIDILSKQFPKLPQVAVFDTAFHQTLPEAAFIYGLPYEYYEKYGVRRYGFHGTSHRFVSEAAAHYIKKPYEESAIITAHLGNGCSASAVLNGKSVDTTMGLTPLEGLLMGTRSGDIDPSIHQFLANELNCDLKKVTSILNKESGLLGISELSNDMRTLCDAAENGNTKAQLAIDVFCYKLAKSIAGLATPLGRIDALVFTGGIGENAANIREQTLSHLAIFGFKVDKERNEKNIRGNEGIITSPNSTPALAIATQEEWMIAQDTLDLI